MRSVGRDARAYAKALGSIFVLAAGLSWTGGAVAATPPPPEDVPAVSAYVELVPTSRGQRSPGVGPTERSTLPRTIEAQLAREGGSDAPLLKEIATSPAYGAPRVSKPLRREPEPEPTRESTVGAGVTVMTDGGDDRLLALGLVLLALTAGAGAAAYLRR
jgi:hypothetical protein